MNIIKRDGGIERYDEKKVYASVFESCINAHISKKKSYEIARKITNNVNKKMKRITKINSNVLFLYIANILRKHSEDAAFLFATHRDVN